MSSAGRLISVKKKIADSPDSHGKRHGTGLRWISAGFQPVLGRMEVPRPEAAPAGDTPGGPAAQRPRWFRSVRA